MKSTLLTLFSVVVMITSCKCKKATNDVVVSSEKAPQDTEVTQDNVAMVEYEANTRGYFLQLKYANDELLFTNQRDVTQLDKVVLTKEQITELNALLADVKPEALPGLKDPTQKRFYDGAAIAHLKITSGGKEFNTVDFDHGFPPAQIEKFINKLVSYTEQKVK